jgi:hypothetical protein
MEALLEFLSHIKNPGRAGAQQPFVGVGGEEIDRFDGGRKGAEGLNGIHAEENVALPKRLADRAQVNLVTGDEVA